MPADVPTIIASSIGFDSRGRDRCDWDAGPVFDLAADLSGAAGTPKVCLPGHRDRRRPARIASAYSALANRFRASHVELFAMPNIDDVRGHFLSQDVIWVGGGSVANLLALWRLHGWDEYLQEAWQAGVVLGGVSAGSICWHNGGTTDSFGPSSTAGDQWARLSAVLERGALQLRVAAPAVVPPVDCRRNVDRRLRHR